MNIAEDFEVSIDKQVVDTMKAWLGGEPVWPYAKILSDWGAEFENYRINWRMPSPIERTMILMQTRDVWIKLFGYAIPCAELLDELAKANHVVEVGAGTGYMTHLMRLRGVDVVGSDPGDTGYRFECGLFDPAQVRAQGKTMVRRYPNSTVFCSWPSLEETWFRQMLKSMRIGQRLIVIREEACAESSAWDYLDACFAEDAVIHIPAFQHLNDYAAVYTKKRQRSKEST